MAMKYHTERLRAALSDITAGDEILLSGTIYTARDAAHLRIMQALEDGTPLPFPIQDAIIYYAGPTQALSGWPVGSCGPTTSGRMDRFAPRLLDLGLLAMIGKGERSEAVCQAITRNGAAYFCAIGGAGALAAKCIKSLEVIAYEDLGCESVKRLQIEDFPVICAIDGKGGNLFQEGRKKYEKV